MPDFKYLKKLILAFILCLIANFGIRGLNLVLNTIQTSALKCLKVESKFSAF